MSALWNLKQSIMMNPADVSTLEFETEYHDCIRYHWLYQLCNSPAFLDFCGDHPELSHYLPSPTSALPAPQAVLASLPTLSLTVPDSSTIVSDDEGSPLPRGPITNSAWTLVTRKSRSTLSVPVAIPVTVSSLPRTSKTPQPADLDFDHYEESEEPSDWSMPSPISKPISSLAQTHDNMSWYTPNGSATPTSFLAQTFYCSLYAGTVATVTRFATAVAYTPSLSVPHRYSISTFLLSHTKLLPPLISLCLFATLARLFIRMSTCLLQLPKLNKPSSDSFHHVTVTPLHSLRLAQGALGVGGSVRSMVVLQ